MRMLKRTNLKTAALMKINNPAVTLADEARTGVKEEVRSGFLDWLHQFTVTGDDGEIYSLGGSILSLAVEQIDLVSVNVAKGKGGTRQLSGSIYKVTEYPGMAHEKLFKLPKGTLCVETGEHSVHVRCSEHYEVECFDDHSWHLKVDMGDGSYKADLWHRPEGYPLWYGREKPSFLTQHSVTYGYNWSGRVDGTIWFEGREVKVEGFGIRERYVAVDSSAAELGGWEDWGFFAFNEIHSSMYDMRLGMKDLSVYDLQTGKHYAEGKMNIVHGDWAFMRSLDGFIPSSYDIEIEVEDGIYRIAATVCNATTWGVTFRVPDNPVATLTFDKVEGSFTSRDGSVRHLTGGKGALSVRQWHAYPNILPRELFSDELFSGEKFATL